MLDIMLELAQILKAGLDPALSALSVSANNKASMHATTQH